MHNLVYMYQNYKQRRKLSKLEKKLNSAHNVNFTIDQRMAIVEQKIKTIENKLDAHETKLANSQQKS